MQKYWHTKGKRHWIFCTDRKELKEVKHVPIVRHVKIRSTASPYHYYPNELIDKINERIEVAVKQDELVIYVQNIGRRKKEHYVSEFVDGLSIVSDRL